MEVGKHHAAFGQAINGGRSYFTAKVAQVIEANVVQNHQQDIGLGSAPGIDRRTTHKKKSRGKNRGQ
jgi:hypothetical protein